MLIDAHYEITLEMVASLKIVAVVAGSTVQEVYRCGIIYLYIECLYVFIVV